MEERFWSEIEKDLFPIPHFIKNAVKYVLQKSIK